MLLKVLDDDHPGVVYDAIKTLGAIARRRRLPSPAEEVIAAITAARDRFPDNRGVVSISAKAINTIRDKQA